MTASLYRVPVTLEITIQASSAGAAKEKIGQVVELLPVRMESVLSRLRITRHDVAVEYHHIASTAAPVLASPATYKAPLQVLMEMEADSRDEACAKAEAVLTQVPAKMQPVFSKYNVVGVNVVFLGDPVQRASSATPGANIFSESGPETDGNTAAP